MVNSQAVYSTYPKCRQPDRNERIRIRISILSWKYKSYETIVVFFCIVIILPPSSNFTFGLPNKLLLVVLSRNYSVGIRGLIVSSNLEMEMFVKLLLFV